MTIKVNNVTDFICVLAELVQNNENNVRIFASESQSYPSISFADTLKNHVKFSYVLIHNTFSCVFQDNVPVESYNQIKETILDFHDNNIEKTKIIFFEKSFYDSDSDTLSIEKELKII